MIDVAQTSMAAGAACAIAQVTGVNDNMSQSHYHDYFELYFLDSGERYHLMDDKLFKLQAGDCILFPPQTMHRSYGDQDIAFSRAVLYFRPDLRKRPTRYPAPHRKRAFLSTTRYIRLKRTIPALRGRINRRNLPSAARNTGLGS